MNLNNIHITINKNKENIINTIQSIDGDTIFEYNNIKNTNHPIYDTNSKN